MEEQNSIKPLSVEELQKSLNEMQAERDNLKEELSTLQFVYDITDEENKRLRSFTDLARNAMAVIQDTTPNYYKFYQIITAALR